MIKMTFYLCDMDSKPTLFFPDFEAAQDAIPITDGVAVIRGTTGDGKPRSLVINMKRLIFAEMEEQHIGGQVVGLGDATMPRATEVTRR